MLRTSQVREICISHFYLFIPFQKKEHLLDITLYILCNSVLPHRNSNLNEGIKSYHCIIQLYLQWSSYAQTSKWQIKINKNASTLLPRHFIAFYSCIEIRILSFIWKQTPVPQGQWPNFNSRTRVSILKKFHSHTDEPHVCTTEIVKCMVNKSKVLRFQFSWQAHKDIKLCGLANGYQNTRKPCCLSLSKQW